YVDVDRGENLAVGQRVARVVDLSRIEVGLRIPAGARSSVRVGDEVMLRSSGSVTRSWPARVARIAPEDDQATRTMTVWAEVGQDPDGPGGLAPGQFLRAMVTSSENSLRWIVPRRALMGDRIQLIEDGRVVSRTAQIDFQLERQHSELGLPDVQWVVLKDPLQKGELVVVNPSRSVQDGMKVEAVSSAGGEDQR
ncbi:MAG: HlyD family efflux transporter periplasmic adaptor subunit, partial [Phycisphaerales bacterium]